MRGKINGPLRALAAALALFLALGLAFITGTGTLPGTGRLAAPPDGGTDMTDPSPDEEGTPTASLVVVSDYSGDAAVPERQTGGAIDLTVGEEIGSDRAPAIAVVLSGIGFGEPEKEDFTLEGLPQGVEFELARFDETTAWLVLSGAPEAAGSAELTVTVKLGGGLLGLGRETLTAQGQVTVTAAEPAPATLEGRDLQLTVGEALEEGVVLKLTLRDLQFIDEPVPDDFTVQTPDGLKVESVKLLNKEKTVAELSLTGRPNSAKQEPVHLELTIDKDQFMNEPEKALTVQSDFTVTVATKSGDPGSINNQQPPADDIQVPPAKGEPGATLQADPLELTAGQEPEEDVKLELKLTGVTFAAKGEQDPEHFTFEPELPKGLTYTVTAVSDTVAEIVLTGTPKKSLETAELTLTVSADALQFGEGQEPSELTAEGVLQIAVAGGKLPMWVPIAGAGALAVVVLAVILLLVLRRGKGKNAKGAEAPAGQPLGPVPGMGGSYDLSDEPTLRMETPRPAAAAAPAVRAVRVGKLHNIGRRPSQQDSMGVVDLEDGVLAVVADGMGGLSGGDQVSQTLVKSLLRQGTGLRPGQMDGVLNAMVRTANEEVNRMLGPSGLYKSGSTLVAALVRGGAFHWISVGDSRVYLYRAGAMLQLNQEHTYEMELRQRVMNGEISAAEAAKDPQRRGLTSFIGMGKLKYVDASLRAVKLMPGDRLLLMSDGVFNKTPETVMADILARNPDVQQAAQVLEEQVLALQDPAQDNFTAIILDCQG